MLALGSIKPPPYMLIGLAGGAGGCPYPSYPPPYPPPYPPLLPFMLLPFMAMGGGVFMTGLFAGGGGGPPPREASLKTEAKGFPPPFSVAAGAGAEGKAACTSTAN